MSENADNNTNDSKKESEEAKPKKRLMFHMPLPERPSVCGCALVVSQIDVGQSNSGHVKSPYESEWSASPEQATIAVDVAAGDRHSLILSQDGDVFTVGCNDEGALGRPAPESFQFIPGKIELPGKALKISAGGCHSACLLEDGRVFAWGTFRDAHGNIGLTLDGNKPFPVDILPGISCCDIASGSHHLVMLTCAGKVYTVGSSEQGQLGRISVRSVAGNGRCGKMTQLKPGLVILKKANPIDAIWATNYCTFLRESRTGTMWGFGMNNYKQLIHSDKKENATNPIKLDVNDIKQIAGGQHHTVVLKTDGGIYTIGNSYYGRLGLGDGNNATELIEIPSLKDKKVTNISSGDVASFAVTDDGQLYTWQVDSDYQVDKMDQEIIEPTLIMKEKIHVKRFIKASSGGHNNIFLVESELLPTEVPETKNNETSVNVNVECNTKGNKPCEIQPLHPAKKRRKRKN